MTAIEGQKTANMTPKEIEQYQWEKKYASLFAIKSEKQKELDGESVDIYEYHNYFNQFDYVQDLDRNFQIFLGIDIYYLKVSISYFKAIRANKRL